MPYSNSDTRLNLSAGLASVTVAGLLVGLKLWAFWQTGALSIAASLADSAMDLLISGAGLGAIIYAARPADDDHAFGHSSVEDLASLGQALFILGSAGAIAAAAIGRLMAPAPAPLEAQSIGIAVMAISALVTAGLVGWQYRVAQRTGNRVVAADMLHYVGDLLPTLGAIAALWMSVRFGWTKVDSLVALAAAAIMARGAIHIGLSAWDALMDRAAPQEIIDGIAEIAESWPGVRGFHDLKTRTAGARIFVQLHIELDGAQSLSAAHAIAASLKRAIIEAYPQADVIIHKDVWHD